MSLSQAMDRASIKAHFAAVVFVLLAFLQHVDAADGKSSIADRLAEIRASYAAQIRAVKGHRGTDGSLDERSKMFRQAARDRDAALRQLVEEYAEDPVERMDSADCLAIGEIYDALKEPRRAEPYARRAVEIAPNDFAAWKLLVGLLIDLETYDEADRLIAEHRGAFREPLSLTGFELGLSSIYESKGEYARAAGCIDRYIALICHLVGHQPYLIDQLDDCLERQDLIQTAAHGGCDVREQRCGYIAAFERFSNCSLDAPTDQVVVSLRAMQGRVLVSRRLDRTQAAEHLNAWCWFAANLLQAQTERKQIAPYTVMALESLSQLNCLVQSDADFADLATKLTSRFREYTRTPGVDMVLVDRITNMCNAVDAVLEARVRAAALKGMSLDEVGWRQWPVVAGRIPYGSNEAPRIIYVASLPQLLSGQFLNKLQRWSESPSVQIGVAVRCCGVTWDPMTKELETKHGLAFKDELPEHRSFVNDTGYPVSYRLISDHIAISKTLAALRVPASLFIDDNGRVAHVVVGDLETIVCQFESTGFN